MPSADIIPKEKRPRVRKVGYVTTAALTVGCMVVLSLIGEPGRTVFIVSGAMLVMCVVMIETWLLLGMQKGMVALAVIVFVLYQIFG